MKTTTKVPPPPRTPKITPLRVPAAAPAAPAAATSKKASVPPPPAAVRPSTPPAPIAKTTGTIPPPRPYSVLPQPIEMPKAGPAVKFKVGDKCVHPAHGVGEVTGIEEKNLGGTVGMFYTLAILHNGMKVMVPMTAASQVGLRPIMSAKEADNVLDTMRAREVAVDLQPWSRRFRAYTEMIKSGSAFEIAKVLRDMYRLKFDKELSFGERRLLDQAKGLLLKELAFAKKVPEADMASEIANIFAA